MAFTVKDLQSLLRLLEPQPEWKEAVRASLLGKEFLELPVLVRDLLRAQRATQRQIRGLVDAQWQVGERVGRLEAVDAGQISCEDRADVIPADVVCSGRREGQDVYLVVEVSRTVEAGDVERGLRRAQILQTVVPQPVLAAVAGEQLARDSDTVREARSVLDGRVEGPE